MTLLERLMSSAVYSPEGVTNGATAPAAEDTTTTTAESGAEENSTTIKDILDFDPFEPAPAGKADSEKPEAKAKVTPKEPSGKEKAAGDDPSSIKAEDSKPKESDPVLRELERINTTLAESQRPKAEEGKKAPPGPRFDFDIPTPILDAILSSEDPKERATALRAYGNGIANLVHREMSQEFGQQLSSLVQALPTIFSRMNGEVSSQQKATEDFFGRFSTLKRSDAMLSYVREEAKALATEMHQSGKRNLSWNEEFRENLGKRVCENLGIPFPEKSAEGQKPNGTTAAKQPKKPMFTTGANAKGGSDATKAPNEAVAEIWDTLGFPS